MSPKRALIRLTDETHPSVESWAVFLRANRGLQPSTVRRYTRIVGHLLDYVGKKPAGVGAEDLDRWMQALLLGGLADGTRRTAATAAREFFDFLSARGSVESPASRLRGPRSYITEAPSLTRGEVRKLLLGPRPGHLPSTFVAARDRVLVALSYALGLRVSEPGRLRLDGLIWEGSVPSVLVERSKWSREDWRLTAYEPAVARMLGAYLSIRSQAVPTSPWLLPAVRGHQLSAKGSERAFKRLVVEAGIRPRGRKISFHILRHTRASELSRAGVETRAIQGFLRHRDATTTARYIHHRRGDLARQVRAAGYLSDRPVSAPDLGSAARALLTDIGQAGVPYTP